MPFQHTWLTLDRAELPCSIRGGLNLRGAIILSVNLRAHHCEPRQLVGLSASTPAQAGAGLVEHKNAEALPFLERRLVAS